MNNERNKKIDKINKLLLLAEENQNPGEKRAAKAKAYQIMNEYSIDESEIPFFRDNQAYSSTDTYSKTKAGTSSENLTEWVKNIREKTYCYNGSKLGRIIASIIKGLAYVILQIIKIPIVWQSIFVIGWFAMMIQFMQHLSMQGNPGTGWMLILGSIIFLWYWIRNLIVAYLFLLFLYFVSSTGIDYIATKFF